MVTASLEIDRQRLIGVVTLIIVAAIIGSASIGLRVNWASFFALYILSAVFAVFLPYLRWRSMTSLYSACENTAISAMIVPSTLALTYSATKLGLPMADGKLGSADSVLRFSTHTLVAFVDKHDTLGHLLNIAYTSLMYQIMFIPFVLCSVGLTRRAYQFMLGYLLLIITCTICSIPFPSHGALVGQGFDPRHFRWVNQSEAYGFLASFDAVRNDAGFILNAQNASGIVTFPSLHAAMAALCAWAVWPSRVFRLPFLILNAFMMVSAVACGGHYLVDVIAGCLLAMAVSKVVVMKSWRLGWDLRSATGRLATQSSQR